VEQTLLPAWRELPIYQDGVAVGTLIGVRLALDAIDAERVRLTTERPDSGSSACRAYADGRLVAVARVLAGRFRT
jgi:hypothetical protein